MHGNIQNSARDAYSFYKGIIDSLSKRGGVSSLSFDELNELYNISLKAQKMKNLQKFLKLARILNYQYPTG